MWRRFVAFADRHAWVITLLGLTVMVVIVAASVTWNQRRETRSTRDQITVIAQQNVAIEKAFINGCKLAVGNGRDTNLKIMGFLKDEMSKRPSAVAAITELENIILREQNPDTICVLPPKENP